MQKLVLSCVGVVWFCFCCFLEWETIFLHLNIKSRIAYGFNSLSINTKQSHLLLGQDMQHSELTNMLEVSHSVCWCSVAFFHVLYVQKHYKENGFKCYPDNELLH